MLVCWKWNISMLVLLAAMRSPTFTLRAVTTPANGAGKITLTREELMELLALALTQTRGGNVW